MSAFWLKNVSWLQNNPSSTRLSSMIMCTASQTIEHAGCTQCTVGYFELKRCKNINKSILLKHIVFDQFWFITQSIFEHLSNTAWNCQYSYALFSYKITWSEMYIHCTTCFSPKEKMSKSWDARDSLTGRFIAPKLLSRHVFQSLAHSSA